MSNLLAESNDAPRLCEASIEVLETIDDGHVVSDIDLRAVADDLQLTIVPIAQRRISELPTQLEALAQALELSPDSPTRSELKSMSAEFRSIGLSAADECASTWHLSCSLAGVNDSHPLWMHFDCATSPVQRILVSSQSGFDCSRAAARVLLLRPSQASKQIELLCRDFPTVEQARAKQLIAGCEPSLVAQLSRMLTATKSTPLDSPGLPAPRPVRPIHLAFLAALIFFSVRLYCQ